MKRFLSSLLVLLASFVSLQAASYDDWTSYFSYNDGQQAVEAGGVVYAVMNGNLMAYHRASSEVITYDRVSHGLSGKTISLMDYCATLKTLVLVYDDGNIDLLNLSNGHVRNIPQFKDQPDNDFGLNRLLVCGDDAYLATNEGFISISIRKGVINNRYPIGGTSCVLMYDDRIYAAMKEGGILVIDRDDNGLDKTRWQPFTTRPVSDMATTGEWLYMSTPYSAEAAANNYPGLWVYSTSEGEQKRITGYATRYVRSLNGDVIAYGGGVALSVAKDAPTVMKSHANFSESVNSITPASDGGYWVARAGQGVTHFSFNADTFVADATPIRGDGPLYERPFYLSFAGDRLLMTPGRLDADDDTNNFPFHATYMDSDGEWHELEVPTVEGGWLQTRKGFVNATAMVQDPLDPAHHFVTSGRNGLFEYRDGKIVQQYTQANSPIRSAAGAGNYDYIRCDAPIFDDEGNLFFSNTSVDTTFYCLKRDGRFVPFYSPVTAQLSNFEHALFDHSGRLWVTQRRYAGNTRGGFLCIDFNGTIDNTKDDIYTYRSVFTNQDGTAFVANNAYSMAIDHDGRIWMGTNAGLIVCDNPDEWAADDFRITQVKVPRNDGTNYADYLLDGAAITAIAVDGANRKWIGTDTDGLYFVSADGTVTLEHFTMDNSPLVSNTIWSLACHPTSGEVFVGTDKGLVCFQSDASQPADELSQDNIRVFPNPVRHDYEGPVTLQGLTADCDVKVVNTAGHTVADGTSHGGTFVWNARGYNGERVATGIYYFMIADPAGGTATVAKVAVVR